MDPVLDECDTEFFLEVSMRGSGVSHFSSRGIRVCRKVLDSDRTIRALARHGVLSRFKLLRIKLIRWHEQNFDPSSPSVLGGILILFGILVMINLGVFNVFNSSSSLSAVIVGAVMFFVGLVVFVVREFLRMGETASHVLNMVLWRAEESSKWVEFPLLWKDEGLKFVKSEGFSAEELKRLFVLCEKYSSGDVDTEEEVKQIFLAALDR